MIVSVKVWIFILKYLLFLFSTLVSKCTRQLLDFNRG